MTPCPPRLLVPSVGRVGVNSPFLTMKPSAVCQALGTAEY